MACVEIEIDVPASAGIADDINPHEVAGAALDAANELAVELSSCRCAGCKLLLEQLDDMVEPIETDTKRLDEALDAINKDDELGEEWNVRGWVLLGRAATLLGQVEHLTAWRQALKHA
jgi:hypothetical protein